MSNSVYTYALIRSLYERGQDYIDSFWPFAVKVLPGNKKCVELQQVQEEIAKKFKIEIPLHTLKTILTRAKRNDYIVQDHKKFRLTDQGLEYQESLELKKDVERRLSELVEDIRQYLNTKYKISLERKKIETSLIKLIGRNIDVFTELFCSSDEGSDLSDVGKVGKYLVEYIEVAQERKPKHYQTLQDIVFGSVISLALKFDNIAEIDRKFEGCTIFLDSNFVFSVLGFHSPDFNDPAKELFSLLKTHRFRVKVFSFTVDEICSVIKGYIEKSKLYPSTIKVDSIYGNLKELGWDRADAREFITNIEENLAEKGIDIDYSDNLQNYKPYVKNYGSLIQKYKPNQSVNSRKHDLAAIGEIRERRKKPLRRIEKAKLLFLTSDANLTRFNFKEMGHKANGTIGEVILDDVLTNILWLKTPREKMSITSIIAAYSHELFIKRKVWERFVENLKRLKRKGKIDDEDASMLFYHGYIEDRLSEIDEQEADAITEGFILEKIEQASARIENKIKKQVKLKFKDDFSPLLEEKISKVEERKEEEWFEKIKGIKRNVLKSAEKTGQRYSIAVSSFLTLVVLGLMYIIYLIGKKFIDREFLLLLIPILLGGSGIWGLWSKAKSFSALKLSEYIYRKKLKEANLDKLDLREKN